MCLWIHTHAKHQASNIKHHVLSSSFLMARSQLYRSQCKNIATGGYKTPQIEFPHEKNCCIIAAILATTIYWVNGNLSILQSLQSQINLARARSRLYRRRFLQVNTRWQALAKIYLHNALLCTVLQSQNFSQKSSTFVSRLNNEFPMFFIFFVEFCIFLRIFDEFFFPDFATNSRKEWRVSP